MSSRVQKGNTVFRPLAKARARTVVPSVSRQASAFPEPLPDSSDAQGSSSLPNIPAVVVHGSTHASDLSDPLLGDSSITGTPPTISETAPVHATKPPPVLPSVTAVPPALPKPSVPIVVGTRGPRPIPLTPTIIPVPTPTSSSTAHFQPRSVVPPSIQTSRPQHPPTAIRVPINPPTNVSGPAESLNSSRVTPSDSIRAPAILTSSNSTSPPNPEDQTQEVGPKTRRRKKGQDDARQTTKKRRTKSTDPEDTENERESSSSKHPRSRASSSTPRPWKRAPSVPSYDPDADPGEEVDPTTMTMAELCVDTGQGRVSRKAAEILNNHAAWKTKNREKRARMRALMEAKKYGRDEEEDEGEQRQDATQDEDSASASPTAGPSASSGNNAPDADDNTTSFDYSQDLATSRFNVQVRIGPNGEMIIDEESLVVDRVENDGTENYTHVVESDHTKFVNSGTYSKRFRGSRWSAEETELFYDALAQYGENYELIAYVLPGRDRKSCKNKFKAEDKKNHARINHCLANSIPVDVKTLSRMTGKDFSGPVPEIRVPPPVQISAPDAEEDEAATQNEGPSRPVKKRSRSKSQGHNDSDVMVIGDAMNFDDS